MFAGFCSVHYADKAPRSELLRTVCERPGQGVFRFKDRCALWHGIFDGCFSTVIAEAVRCRRCVLLSVGRTSSLRALLCSDAQLLPPLLLLPCSQSGNSCRPFPLLYSAGAEKRVLRPVSLIAKIHSDKLKTLPQAIFHSAQPYFILREQYFIAQLRQATASGGQRDASLWNPFLLPRISLSSNINTARPAPIYGRTGVLHMGGMNLVTALPIPAHKGSACRLRFMVGRLSFSGASTCQRALPVTGRGTWSSR